jgi:hypothetical protein
MAVIAGFTTGIAITAEKLQALTKGPAEAGLRLMTNPVIFGGVLF